MRKKEVVPKDIYNSERETDANSKDLLNLVVVGHVDSGKSTLMGHLLVELGQGKSWNGSATSKTLQVIRIIL